MEKRKSFAIWLQRKGQEIREEYKRKRRDARIIIAESKRESKKR
jgi:hypothetical protein